MYGMGKGRSIEWLNEVIHAQGKAACRLSDRGRTLSPGQRFFTNYTLGDPGAYPEPPLGDRISWQVTQPWAEPVDEGEREAKRRAEELMERLRARNRSKTGI